MIIRTKKTSNYFCMSNDIANNSDLSPVALTILVFILAKPDTWNIYPKQIAEKRGLSLKAVYSGIKQLIKHGYIKREMLRGKARIERWSYTVYESPIKPIAENNLVENKLVEFNLVDLGTHYNIVSTNRVNTNKVSTVLNNITDSGESVASVQATTHIVNKNISTKQIKDIADKREHQTNVIINDSLSMSQASIRQEHQTAQKESSNKDLIKEPFYLSRSGRKLTGEFLNRFNDFWNAFDFKQGKADAAEEFFNLSKKLNLSNADYEKIIKAAKQEAKNRPLIIGQGRQAKWAAGWLAGRRWEDEQQGITGNTGNNISNDTGFNGALNDNTCYPVQTINTGNTGFNRAFNNYNSNSARYCNSFTPIYGEMTPHGFPSTGSRKLDNNRAAMLDAQELYKQIVARREALKSQGVDYEGF